MKGIQKPHSTSNPGSSVRSTDPVVHDGHVPVDPPGRPAVPGNKRLGKAPAATRPHPKGAIDG